MARMDWENLVTKQIVKQAIRAAMATVFCLAFLGILPGPGWAAEVSTDQAVTLVAPQAKAPIPIYLRPAPNQPNVGYGVNGDAVTVMEQVASFLPEADPSTAWNHIRLERDPYTEGWVQGKFLSLYSGSE